MAAEVGNTLRSRDWNKSASMTVGIPDLCSSHESATPPGYSPGGVGNQLK